MEKDQETNKKQFPAHIRGDRQEDIQSVEEHCLRTAKYAAEAAEAAGLSKSAYFAGALHDAGKYTDAFSDYLRRSAAGEKVKRGSVNHTFCGCRMVLERFHNGDPERFDGLASELLAFAIGAHHGLFDCVDDSQCNGFEHRSNKEGIYYDEAVENYLRYCMDERELLALFNGSLSELTDILNRIGAITGDDVDDRVYDQETSFYIGLLARLLLSAVIEGDRRDTAEFVQGTVFPEYLTDEERRSLWRDRLEEIERKLDKLPQKTEIDRARRNISDQCRRAAERPSGVCRLHVPTGGGKTLSSLRYAVAHAAACGKRHIFFVSPLLSILDQNARVIRDYVQNDALILEHHSDLVHASEDGEELDKRELLTESWDAPIVITTLVQLLNTLFSGKSDSIRRFHALCGSVIVIDEVQTVPTKMLSLFSLAVNFLASICNTTVVLCSATQPCLEHITHPIRLNVPELVPYDPKIWAVFRRTEIRDAGSMSLDGIAGLAEDALAEVDSLLIVCNKKDEAVTLFKRMKERVSSCFHLSASMCVAHRRKVLDALKEPLAEGEKRVCVSTQVIEAGVDISFQRVIRLSAGMDSVVQAAGRCNRSGEAGEGVTAPVCLVECQGEKLTFLKEIQNGKDATLALLAEYRRQPERFRHRLDSDEAIRYYYQSLYGRMAEEHPDHAVKSPRCTVFDLLSINSAFAQERDGYCLHQAFKLAGELFEVFDQDTTDVIVPYGEGRDIIAGLSGGQAKDVKALLDSAKPYSVSLYRYQTEQLERMNALYTLDCGATALVGHYDPETGFTMETSLDFLEV